MKVVSYNTLFGGFDGAKRERFEAQLQLIRELDPDVLALQEARGFEANGNAVLLETEQRLAMRGFLGLAPHTGQNTAIFVKVPLRALSVVADNEHFHHARLTVIAEVPGFTDPVSFISVHLCPNAAHVRQRRRPISLTRRPPRVGAGGRRLQHHQPARWRAGRSGGPAAALSLRYTYARVFFRFYVHENHRHHRI